MTYENGLVIALFMWLAMNVMVLVNEFSLFNRNLKKVGFRLSWLSGEPKTLTSEDVDRPMWKSLIKYLFLAGTGLISCLLSWLYVAIAVGIYVHQKAKDSGAPGAHQKLSMANAKCRYGTRPNH